MKTEKGLTCKICFVSATSKQELKYHRFSHDHREYQCDTCDYKVTGLHKITSHKQIHKPSTCPYCKKKIGSKGRSRHMKYHCAANKEATVENKKCPQCDFQTKSPYSLKNHIKTHLKKRCSICGYVTDHENALIKHIKKRHEPKPEPKPTSIVKCIYKCKGCSYSSTRKRNVARHEEVYCPNRGYLFVGF